MGDHPRSQPLDLHHFFKIPKTKSLKEVGKVYKSFVSKRHNDKRVSEDNANRRVDEDIWSPKFLSRSASRKAMTPTPKSRPLSRHGSRRCTTPTSLSRSSSGQKSATEIAASSLKRIMSKRSSSASLSRSLSTLDISEPELLRPAASSAKYVGSGIKSSRETEHIPKVSPTKDVGAGTKSFRETEHIPAVSLSSNLSRRATTPIIFSQSTARRKPSEVERTLSCTLEDLCFGSIKKIKVTRDAIKHPGVIIQEEEVLKIEVKPGWRKGTKITFEGVGDEKPGYLPADIVFLIDEKTHPLFSRDGNNLEICVEIPLVDALTGCSIPIPLLGGEYMTLSLENIVYPGYEEVIKGQGMPNPKKTGIRGDLHVKFLIDFPTELSEKQRKEAVSILQDLSLTQQHQYGATNSLKHNNNAYISRPTNEDVELSCGGGKAVLKKKGNIHHRATFNSYSYNVSFLNRCLSMWPNAKSLHCFCFQTRYATYQLSNSHSLHLSRSKSGLQNAAFTLSALGY
ncbi:hypothetical protein VNO77_22390 [Canavalia gladiata]|uniref:Chaperone DnaJ C-terminal domain-containing protein n=1 Tax=Canavalia gladiata TaxID=3824 RepID=A0AAN9L2N5_CANGL